MHRRNMIDQCNVRAPTHATVTKHARSHLWMFVSRSTICCSRSSHTAVVSRSPTAPQCHTATSIVCHGRAHARARTQVVPHAALEPSPRLFKVRLRRSTSTTHVTNCGLPTRAQAHREHSVGTLQLEQLHAGRRQTLAHAGGLNATGLARRARARALLDRDMFVSSEIASTLRAAARSCNTFRSSIIAQWRRSAPARTHADATE